MGTPSLPVTLEAASNSFQPDFSYPSLLHLGWHGLAAVSTRDVKISQEAFSRKLEVTDAHGRNMDFGVGRKWVQVLGLLFQVLCDLFISLRLVFFICKMGLINSSTLVNDHQDLGRACLGFRKQNFEGSGPCWSYERRGKGMAGEHFCAGRKAICPLKMIECLLGPGTLLGPGEAEIK